MSQVTNLLQTPNLDIGPQMSIDEAARRILFIVNQLPNFIGGTSGGATAANQTTEIGYLTTIATNSGNPSIYQTVPTTRTNGQTGLLETDTTGTLKVVEQFAPVAEDNTNGVYAEQILPIAANTYAYSAFQNLAANATLNIKASAGNVFSCKCHNINAASRYFQLHNTATVPAGGAVPIFSFLVPTASEIIIANDFFGPGGIYFSTGIAFAFSTTEGTYTAGTSTDQFSYVNYK